MLFPFLSGSTRNESLSYDRLVRFGSIEACVSKVRSFACQRPPSNAGTTRLNYRWNRNDPGALSLHGKYGVSGISPLRRNRKLILIIQSCTYRRSVRLNLSIGISSIPLAILGIFPKRWIASTCMYHLDKRGIHVSHLKNYKKLIFPLWYVTNNYGYKIDAKSRLRWVSLMIKLGKLKIALA